MDDEEIKFGELKSYDILNILAEAMKYSVCYLNKGELQFVKYKTYKFSEKNIKIASPVYKLIDGKFETIKFDSYNEALKCVYGALMNNIKLFVISLFGNEFYAAITPELAGEFLFECALHGDLLADDS